MLLLLLWLILAVDEVDDGELSCLLDMFSERCVMLQSKVIPLRVAFLMPLTALFASLRVAKNVKPYPFWFLRS